MMLNVGTSNILNNSKVAKLKSLNWTNTSFSAKSAILSYIIWVCGEMCPARWRFSEDSESDTFGELKYKNVHFMFVVFSVFFFSFVDVKKGFPLFFSNE